jgi:hypothetical protein
MNCVYGPQEDDDKITFIDLLRVIRSSRPGSRVLCGDFNLMYREEHKNNGKSEPYDDGKVRALPEQLRTQGDLSPWEAVHLVE